MFLVGLEPTATWLWVRRSNRLSYKNDFFSSQDRIRTCIKLLISRDDSRVFFIWNLILSYRLFVSSVFKVLPSYLFVIYVDPSLISLGAPQQRLPIPPPDYFFSKIFLNTFLFLNLNVFWLIPNLIEKWCLQLKLPNQPHSNVNTIMFFIIIIFVVRAGIEPVLLLHHSHSLVSSVYHFATWLEHKDNINYHIHKTFPILLSLIFI